MIRVITFIIGVGVGLCAAAAPPDAAEVDFFEKKVRPVLVERCYSCHSAKEGKSKGGLLLDSKDGWARGGDSGPVIVPGDLAKSLLVRAIRYDDPELQMPPKGKLPQAEIDVLVQWVQRGAPDPRVRVAREGQAKALDLASAQKHWAYRPIQDARPPAVRDAAWPINDIDRFVLAGLVSCGLRSVSDSDRLALVRRHYFDLIGILPTPVLASQFVSAIPQYSFAVLLYKLLVAQHFGE